MIRIVLDDLEVEFSLLENDVTVCNVYTLAGVFVGRGECTRYVYDTFNATNGRRRALGRALKSSGSYTKEEYKEVVRMFDEFVNEFNMPDKPPRKRRDIGVTVSINADEFFKAMEILGRQQFIKQQIERMKLLGM